MTDRLTNYLLDRELTTANKVYTDILYANVQGSRLTTKGRKAKLVKGVSRKRERLNSMARAGENVLKQVMFLCLSS